MTEKYRPVSNEKGAKGVDGKFYYKGNMQTFQRDGYPTPNNVELPGKSFGEKARQLEASGDAEKLVDRYEFGDAVAKLLETHTIDELTDVFCEQFLDHNPQFTEYHPGTVLAVATIIERRKVIEKARLH